MHHRMAKMEGMVSQKRGLDRLVFTPALSTDLLGIHIVFPWTRRMYPGPNPASSTVFQLMVPATKRKQQNLVLDKSGCQVKPCPTSPSTFRGWLPQPFQTADAKTTAGESDCNPSNQSCTKRHRSKASWSHSMEQDEQVPSQPTPVDA